MEEKNFFQLNQVKENNEKINKLIEQILKIRRERRSSIELKNDETIDVDPKVKILLENEIRKCLEIYKLEFPNYICQGKDTVTFCKTKTTADCYGGTLGLQITYGMQEFIDNKILPVISKMGYKIDENGEVAFDEKFANNSEHSPNLQVKSFSKIVGSTKDQMDYFTLLLAKNGVDLDFVLDALAHEEMHTFGVIDGNNFLKEGTTEELTREICEKYNIHMSPHSHTQEANFVRKLEMLVGRDIVIESGMWTGKFKEKEFEEILEKNSELSYSDLSEMFDLFKIAPQKLSLKENNELKNFCNSNPDIEKDLKNIVDKYRKSEFENKRYSKVAEKFDSELGMQSGSFYKYMEILSNMYTLSSKYKQDPKLYRDIYNLSFNELENEYIVFQTGKPFKDEEKVSIANIRQLCEELSNDNGVKIDSFNDLMTPINEKIIGRTLEKNDQKKDYSKVLEVQQEELEALVAISNEYGIPIESQSAEKVTQIFKDDELEMGETSKKLMLKRRSDVVFEEKEDETLSKEKISVLAKDNDVTNEIENAIEDIEKLENVKDKENIESKDK